MENSANEPHEPNHQTTTEPTKRPIDHLLTGMHRGAEEARKAAEEALPKIRASAMRAGYWAAYGVSFAATFQWTLLEAGAREGFAAGRKAAHKWVEEIMARKQADPERSIPLIGPAASHAQPGPV